ncbi:AAA family ATPase [Paraburkholderia phosphatilytica]|uniref:AAA family ATPase n=1 Tax=Paraburkholderia phosphatilytica TaxID=2282883 RepID=UPI000E4D5265|nr:AAA family ATPase [Paraburkholderia phosphatilytica]
MATVSFILGKSGAGKSTSLRNLQPSSTLLIQALRKALPFKGKALGWDYLGRENPKGNILVSDHAESIIKAMQKTQRKVIVVDDFQYTMANEFMRRVDEKGYDKFNDIGRRAWDIINAAAALPDDVRVFIMSHTEESDDGRTKCKTLGKMLDDKVCLEGMVTIVLQADVVDRENVFITKNNGRTTVKAPMGMFADDMVPNDLAAVDAAICDYYEINMPA